MSQSQFPKGAKYGVAAAFDRVLEQHGPALDALAAYDSTDGGWERSVVVTPDTTDHQYTISEACQEIDLLRASCERWLRKYELLAENLEEVRESRERLRIRCLELEGVIELQFSELRTANAEIDKLRNEKAELTAKANYPRTGW